MAYVEGFVIAVPKDRLEDYKAMARIMRPGLEGIMARSIMWNASATTRRMAKLTSFPRAVQAKDDEVVVFSWIVYDVSATRATPPTRSSIEDPRLKRFDGRTCPSMASA